MAALLAVLWGTFWGQTVSAANYQSLSRSVLENNRQYDYFQVYNVDGKGSPELIVLHKGIQYSDYYVYGIAKNTAKLAGCLTSRLITSQGTPAFSVITKQHALYGYLSQARLGGSTQELKKYSAGKLKTVCTISKSTYPRTTYQFSKGTKKLKKVSKKLYNSYIKKYLGSFNSKSQTYAKVKTKKMLANTAENRMKMFN